MLLNMHQKVLPEMQQKVPPPFCREFCQLSKAKSAASRATKSAARSTAKSAIESAASMFALAAQRATKSASYEGSKNVTKCVARDLSLNVALHASKSAAHFAIQIATGSLLMFLDASNLMASLPSILQYQICTHGHVQRMCLPGRHPKATSQLQWHTSWRSLKLDVVDTLKPVGKKLQAFSAFNM
jgi:hypothetical protein